MDKYGAPTIVGDQHLYYIYHAGKIVSVGVKYKGTTALDAIDRPLDPRAAIKLDGANGQGSCVAVVKRLQTKEKTLNAMLDEAKGSQLRRRPQRAANAGHCAGPGRQCTIHAAGFQAHCQRGRD